MGLALPPPPIGEAGVVFVVGVGVVPVAWADALALEERVLPIPVVPVGEVLHPSEVVLGCVAVHVLSIPRRL